MPSESEADRPRRNTERTRRAVLDAAGQVIWERGTGFSIAEIADAAGVSKSGLLHHFGSRDDLVIAVIEDAIASFRAVVLAAVDLSENRPGKILRAYVRALCGGSPEAMRLFGASPVWHGIMSIERAADVLVEDNAWWHARMSEDGVDAATVHVVRRAAEGMAAAADYGDEDAASLERGRDALLALIDSRLSGA